jgi:hypothetical protein
MKSKWQYSGNNEEVRAGDWPGRWVRQQEEAFRPWTNAAIPERQGPNNGDGKRGTLFIKRANY